MTERGVRRRREEDGGEICAYGERHCRSEREREYEKSKIVRMVQKGKLCDGV